MGKDSAFISDPILIDLFTASLDEIHAIHTQYQD